MYRTRLEIEEGIIAAIIDANAFPIVINVLTVKNFTALKFGVIFRAAQSLYPLIPIDIISLRMELTKWGDKGIEALDYLLTKRFSVYEIKSVQYWCFMLLELDISEAYRTSLVRWHEARIKDGDLVASAVLKEIFLMIGPGVDIFTLVEKAVKYLDHQKMRFEADATRDFEEQTIKKTLQIKSHIGIETALSNIIQIANSSSEVEHVCKTFAMAIGEMVLSNKVKDQHLLAAETLTNASK